MSIPFVSQSDTGSPYHRRMAKAAVKKKVVAPPWAIKMRAHLRATGQSLKSVAIKMGKAESTIRSWMNGNRGPDVPEFIELVRKTKADLNSLANGGTPSEEDRDAAIVMNAWHFGDQGTRDVLLATAKAHAKRQPSRKKANKS